MDMDIHIYKSSDQVKKTMDKWDGVEWNGMDGMDGTHMHMV